MGDAALQPWGLSIWRLILPFLLSLRNLFLSIVLWLLGASDRDCLLSGAYIAFTLYIWRFDVSHFPGHAIVNISNCIHRIRDGVIRRQHKSVHA